MSQILRLAVQHEALRDNPVRHLDPIESSPRAARALTPEERRRFLGWMQGKSADPKEAKAQEAARRRDLPDFVTFMIGTGVRIGEALAVRWCDVDLDGVPVVEGNELRAVPIVAITGNVVRHRGDGLHRHAGKTATSLRIVPLPRFVVDMLRRREVHGDEVPVFPAAGSKRPGLNWKDPNNMTAYIREARLGGEDGLAGHQPHLPQDGGDDLARLRAADGPAEGRPHRPREDQHAHRHLRCSRRAASAGSALRAIAVISLSWRSSCTGPGLRRSSMRWPG